MENEDNFILTEGAKEILARALNLIALAQSKEGVADKTRLLATYFNRLADMQEIVLNALQEREEELEEEEREKEEAKKWKEEEQASFNWYHSWRK